MAGGAVQPKLPMSDNFPETISVNQLTVVSVPVGAKVFWPDYMKTLETDGVIEFTIDTPGEYVFKVTHPHHIKQEYTVNVTA